MFLSRRRFLTLCGAVAAAGAATTLWLRRPKPPVEGPPVLEPAPPGPLDPQDVRTLSAAVEGIIGLPVEASHYEDLFRWRAERLRGYAALYKRFAAALDRTAGRRGGRLFAECDAATRRTIVEGFDVPSGVTAPSRDAALFEKFVFRDVRTLFARTDGLAQIGYDGWPGVPRGLDRYTQAPTRTGRS